MRHRCAYKGALRNGTPKRRLLVASVGNRDTFAQRNGTKNMADVLADLKEWLGQLNAEKARRERQGEEPGIAIKLVERAIVEIEEQRAGKANRS